MDAEQKKEEFQKYLEKNGVIDALTKVLVGLYEVPEKPANPAEFIKEYLGAPVGVDVEQLKKTVEEQASKLQEKDAEIAELKKRIEELSGGDAPEE